MAYDTLSYGSIYWSTPAATANTADVPAKALGTTTTMELSGILHSANNRLTNDSGSTRAYSVMFAGSLTKGSGSTTEAELHIHKNDSLIPGAHVGRRIPNNTDEGAAGVHCQVSLDQGDYVELWIQTNTGDDIQIEAGVLSVEVLG